MFESTNRKRETNEIQLKAAGSVRLWSRSIARLDLVWPKVLVENRHKTLCAWLVFDVSISTILCTVQLICVLPLLWHAIIVCKVIEIMLLQTSKLTRITCVFSVSGCLCVHLLSCYHCSCFQTTCGSFWVLVTEWFHCPVKRKRIKKNFTVVSL